jgi:hypothetical protein
MSKKSLGSSLTNSRINNLIDDYNSNLRNEIELIINQIENNKEVLSCCFRDDELFIEFPRNEAVCYYADFDNKFGFMAVFAFFAKVLRQNELGKKEIFSLRYAPGNRQIIINSYGWGVDFARLKVALFKEIDFENFNLLLNNINKMFKDLNKICKERMF